DMQATVVSAGNAMSSLVPIIAGVSDSVDEMTHTYGRAIGPGLEMSESLEEIDDKAQELIASLVHEQAALQMTEKQQDVFSALLKGGADATADQRAEIIRLVSAIYDQEAALDEKAQAEKDAEKAAEDHRREMERTLDAQQRQWE